MSCCEHHCHLRSSELGEHLGVAGKIIPTGQERGLVDWRSDDSLHDAGLCQLDRALDRSPTQPARHRRIAIRAPAANRLIDLDAAVVCPHDHQIRTLANPWIGERLVDYFRADAARIARSDGQPDGHSLQPQRHVGVLSQVVE